MGPEIPSPIFLGKALGLFPHNAEQNEHAQPKQLEMGWFWGPPVIRDGLILGASRD